VDRTSEAVTRQIVAMGGDVFEIGLYKPEGAGDNEPPMIPRTWDMRKRPRITGASQGPIREIGP
jgi:hypothetical protein